jgi:hypothetical protein
MGGAGTVVEAYEVALNKLWQGLVEIAGIHTVNMLVERALWETAQHHPLIAQLHFNDQGFGFLPFRERATQIEAKEIQQTLTDFYQTLLKLSARLMGQELVDRIDREIQWSLLERKD